MPSNSNDNHLGPPRGFEPRAYALRVLGNGVEMSENC